MRELNVISSLELSEILHKHKLWLLKEPDGICANLSFCNLDGIDLSCKDVRGANFVHSSLACADLTYARACFITAAGADFSGAGMGSSDFTFADFRDANLSFCDLGYSVLNSTNFKGADLQGSNLAFANLMDSNIDLNQIRSIKLAEVEENALVAMMVGYPAAQRQI